MLPSQHRISLREAAELTGYHPDYLSQLIRKNKLAGEQVGRTWLTTKEAVDAYLLTAKKSLPPPKISFSASRSSVVVFVIHLILFFGFLGGVIFYLFNQMSSIEHVTDKDASVTNVTEQTNDGSYITSLSVK